VSGWCGWGTGTADCVTYMGSQPRQFRLATIAGPPGTPESEERGDRQIEQTGIVRFVWRVVGV
jgi:hypothetical protein